MTTLSEKGTILSASPPASRHYSTTTSLSCSYYCSYRSFDNFVRTFGDGWAFLFIAESESATQDKTVLAAQGDYLKLIEKHRRAPGIITTKAFGDEPRIVRI